MKLAVSACFHSLDRMLRAACPSGVNARSLSICTGISRRTDSGICASKPAGANAAAIRKKRFNTTSQMQPPCRIIPQRPLPARRRLTLLGYPGPRVLEGDRSIENQPLAGRVRSVETKIVKALKLVALV